MLAAGRSAPRSREDGSRSADLPVVGAPFALLAAAAMWGDKDAADLWTEYEQATAGKHAIVASAGLSEAYGVGVVDDDEAAVEEVHEPLAVVEVDPVMWMILAAVDQQPGPQPRFPKVS